MNRNGALRVIVVLLAVIMLACAIVLGSGGLNKEITISELSNSLAAVILTDNTSDETTEQDIQSENAEFIIEPDYASEHYIVVFLESQTTVVYKKDASGGYSEAEKCFICSTGSADSPTRTGLYSIRRKYRWRLLVGDVYGQYSSGFSDSYLFHSVPYALQDPSTLDMEGFSLLGKPASHGCVRLCVRDAKWIYDNCDFGTQVNVVDAATDLTGEVVPAANNEALFLGWDPTDLDDASPYLSLTSDSDIAY